MVSIAQTTKKYHGKMAENYEDKRTKQGRWALENAAVEKLLTGQPLAWVLDMPTGTGRFLPLYKKLKVGTVVALDASSSMLSQAKRKAKPVDTVFIEGNATGTHYKNDNFSGTVCIRFLDLIDEEAMQAVMREMARVSRSFIILTIRLGDEYVPKSNTATHDRAKFNALVKKLGWKVEESIPIFEAGWTVMRLGRK